jgi:hypothetical protein
MENQESTSADYEEQGVKEAQDDCTPDCCACCCCGSDEECSLEDET